MKAYINNETINSRETEPLSTSLFIGGLPTNLTNAELLHNLSRIIPIKSVTICKDRLTGVSKGYGFFTCYTHEDAVAFVSKDILIDGRVLKCQLKVFSKTARANKKEARLFLSGVPKSCSDEELTMAFEGAIGLRSVSAIRDHQGTSKGFGFAEFENIADAKQFLQIRNRITLASGTIRIYLYKLKESSQNQADQKHLGFESHGESQRCWMPSSYGFPYHQDENYSFNSNLNFSLTKKLLNHRLESMNFTSRRMLPFEQNYKNREGSFPLGMLPLQILNIEERSTIAKVISRSSNVAHRHLDHYRVNYST